MEKRTLKFANKSPHPDPRYACDGDSGFDLRAWILDTDDDFYEHTINGDIVRSIRLKPLERRLIHTGIYLELPPSTEVQVRPRSGCALRLGLIVANTPGTVDEPYRNEICIIALNISDTVIEINDGDRIAQAVLMPVYNSYLVDLAKVDEVSTDTARGLGGFGHTGMK